jgi:hypothetical protein
VLFLLTMSDMSPVMTVDTEFTSALEACVHALRQSATSELPPGLARRMHELGENKEFLSDAEKEELHNLVELWRQRTVERLEAEVALKRLRDKVPQLFTTP